MPRYKVTLTEQERHEMERLVQKGGKGYRIKHAQILMKLDEIPENAEWTYDRIKDAYSAAQITLIRIPHPLCTRHSRRKKPTESRIGSNGITHQNMAVG